MSDTSNAAEKQFLSLLSRDRSLIPRSAMGFPALGSVFPPLGAGKRTRDAPGSRASEGVSETVAPPHAEALDAAPGLPLDYAQSDYLEGQRGLTDNFRDMMTCKLHPGVINAPLVSGWFRDLLRDGCLSTLQSLDRTGRLEMKKWPVEDFNEMLAMVAVDGNVEMLDWFLARALEVHGKTSKDNVLGFSMNDRQLYRSALEGGSLGVVKWIRARGCPHYKTSLTLAVWHGHADITRWLHADGCPMDFYATAYAAMDGKIEYLKWLRERGCEWNASACALAAASGNLETLKYLRANGCPWNLATALFAQRQACFADPKEHRAPPAAWGDVAAWAANNGLPGHRFYSETAFNPRATFIRLKSWWHGSLIGNEWVCGGPTVGGPTWPGCPEGGYATLLDRKISIWQDRGADIDALIMFALREEFDVGWRPPKSQK